MSYNGWSELNTSANPCWLNVLSVDIYRLW